MKRKLISLMTAVTMIMSLIGAMPQGASAAGTTPTIKLGDYVQIGKYRLSTLSWRCVAFEKATRQADGSIVIDSTEQAILIRLSAITQATRVICRLCLPIRLSAPPKSLTHRATIHQAPTAGTAVELHGAQIIGATAIFVACSNPL